MIGCDWWVYMSFVSHLMSYGVMGLVTCSATSSLPYFNALWWWEWKLQYFEGWSLDGIRTLSHVVSSTFFLPSLRKLRPYSWTSIKFGLGNKRTRHEMWKLAYNVRGEAGVKLASWSLSSKCSSLDFLVKLSRKEN